VRAYDDAATANEIELAAARAGKLAEFFERRGDAAKMEDWKAKANVK
jgi:hypothetical protein